MAWHETLYQVLSVINNVILVLIGIPFTLQVIYMLLFWLPKKTFPVSEKKHRICVIICAHNEEDVIEQTVRRLFERQKYPKELFDVYVVAHNCTDRTAERAARAGAAVFTLNDPDPTSCPMRSNSVTKRCWKRASTMPFPFVWMRTIMSTTTFSRS